MEPQFKELLVYIYITLILMGKEIAVEFKTFAVDFIKVKFDKWLKSSEKSSNYLLRDYGAINSLLGDMCRISGSDLGFIAMFHNGVAKNFLNYSIRFEYNNSGSIMNTYQVKPLSPYFEYLDKMSKKISLVFNTTKTPLFIQGLENEQVYFAPLYSETKTLLKNEGKSLCGCLVIKLSDKSKQLELDSKLVEIQRILASNSELVF